MNRMMITASNTMGQLQKKLDTVSHNLANSETTGYKSKQAYFSDFLVQEINNQERTEKEKGRLTPNGIRVGTGAIMSQSQLNTGLGTIKKTDRDLDVALNKENLYFTVSVQNGANRETRFTRDGAFYLSPVGDQLQLVTSEGYPILNVNNEAILIGSDMKELTFASDGEIRVTYENNGTETIDLGIISVEKPQFLENVSDNTFTLPNNMAQLGVTENEIYTPLTGALRNQVSLTQGALEQSNVDVSTEMTELIQVQRQYQFQSRAVSMADQMMGLVNGIR